MYLFYGALVYFLTLAGIAIALIVSPRFIKAERSDAIKIRNAYLHQLIHLPPTEEKIGRFDVYVICGAWSLFMIGCWPVVLILLGLALLILGLGSIPMFLLTTLNRKLNISFTDDI